MADFYQYKYTGTEQITVQDFIEDDNTPINNEMSAQEFLSYGESFFTNIDFITEKYNKIQLNLYGTEIGSNSPDLIINPGTTLNLPKDNTDIEKILLASENQFLTQGDFEAYMGDYETLLLDKDIDYLRSEKVNIKGIGVDINLYHENIKVWVWIRAIDKIVNVTPFVQNCSISKQSDIGTFNFSLNPVLDLDEVINVNDEFLNYFNINSKTGHTLDFFEKNLQQNDVVFIRFEQLERDKAADSQLKNSRSLFVDTYYLKPIVEHTWDMIGLIDTSNVSYSAMATDKTINVTGRDFMKLLIEDGSYFLPYKYMEGKDTEEKFVWGGNENDSWFKRNVMDGNFQSFFSYEMKGIGNSVKFIINHLSNLGVTPNKLWEPYGEDLTKIYKSIGYEEDVLDKLAVNGVWGIVKIGIDDNIDSRVIAGDALMNPDGTLYEFFNNVCQKPFVEFWGDTYTDTFDFIIRQPPFTEAAIKGVLKNKLYVEIDESDLITYNLSFDTEFYSHYQIEPQAEWMGVTKGIFQSIVPIIYMTKYAEVFGNKRLYVKDNYLSRTSVFGVGKEQKKDIFIESILNDYKYIIESNSYLPFTRKGTITLNGDRRIKKGGFVLNKATNELFYVNGTTNNFNASIRQIDRTTTLSVSRGMKINCINTPDIDIITGKGLVDFPYSYFDIVNAKAITDSILKTTKNNEGGTEVRVKKNTSTDFNVNEDVFDYFLTRKHFN